LVYNDVLKALSNGNVSQRPHPFWSYLMKKIAIFALLTASLTLAACATTEASPNKPSLTALQGSEWRVEDIGGRGVIDNSPATLLFGADGNLSGSATCNRLIASYQIDQSKIKITPAGLTMMACPPALMEQERRLVDALALVVSYRIDQAGALILQTSNQQNILARR
jgi:heat shock protein HslJ